MSDEKKQITVNPTYGSPAFIIFLVFLVLKLTGTITWSWWWVTCPLWISFGLGIALIGFVLFIAILLSVLIAIFE